MRSDLTKSELQARVEYDPVRGIFHWKERPLTSDHRSAQWNVRYVGAVAGDKMKTGYWRLRINDTSYLAHRLAWLYVYGSWPAHSLDHINGNRCDNRIANLRDATPTQNGQNRGMQRNNSLGFKGVHRVNKRFRAVIKAGGVKSYLGIFDTPEEAHRAYVAAAKERFGEFAKH